MAEKQVSRTAESRRVFGQARKQSRMFRAGLHARVSVHDQQRCYCKHAALREYAAKHGCTGPDFSGPYSERKVQYA
jgi:hypothetical protein